MQHFYLSGRIVRLSALLFIITTALVIHSCRKDVRMAGVQQPLTLNSSDINELQGIYASGTSGSKLATLSTANGNDIGNYVRNLNVKWDKYQAYLRADNSQLAEFDIESENFLLSTNQPKAGDTAYCRNKTEAVFIKFNNGHRLNVFMKVIEDFSQTKQSVIKDLHYKQIPSTFTGLIIFYTLDRHFLNGWRYSNGKIAGAIGAPTSIAGSSIQTNSTSKKVNVAQQSCGYTVITETDGYYLADEDGNIIEYLGSTTYQIAQIPDICSDIDPYDNGGGASGDGGSGGGGGSGTGNNTQPPQDTTRVPCIEKVSLDSLEANATIASANAQILSSTAGTGNEYSQSFNIASLSSPNVFTSTSLRTDNSVNSVGYDFSWTSSSHTITKTHSHPIGDDAPSPLDVFSMVSDLNSVKNINPVDSTFYKNHASIAVTTNVANFAVTVNNWNAFTRPISGFFS